MALGPDLKALRGLVGSVVADLKSYPHHALGSICERLGMPVPAEDAGSKRVRLDQGLADLADADLPMVAERILQQLPTSPAIRNAIQDILWAGHSTIDVSARTRREIARDLDLAEFVPYSDRFKALLERLWVLDGGPLGWLYDTPTTLSARIDRHVFRNPGDWSAEDLFEQLEAFGAGNARFVMFLEGLVSAEVVPDEPAQRRVVEIINPHLQSIGVELREIGSDGGYPVFGTVSVQAPHNRPPKNLVFASTAKPDIRFLSAIDNDIEVVNGEDVLIYDRPITADGLLWRDLQAWWKDTQNLSTDEAAKKSLYSRLGACLPQNSAAQQNLFTLYHQLHGAKAPGLPALLPEVWLHWDPKTVRARGREALLRFRMDFLLLLGRGQRVVLEIDGRHHYSTGGRPDSTKYAAGMRADRDLKLSGYEVFRFGADELSDIDQARPVLRQFFADLFDRFEVIPSAG